MTLESVMQTLSQITEKLGRSLALMKVDIESIDVRVRNLESSVDNLKSGLNKLFEKRAALVREELGADPETGMLPIGLGRKIMAQKAMGTEPGTGRVPFETLFDPQIPDVRIGTDPTGNVVFNPQYDVIVDTGKAILIRNANNQVAWIPMKGVESMVPLKIASWVKIEWKENKGGGSKKKVGGPPVTVTESAGVLKETEKAMLVENVDTKLVAWIPKKALISVVPLKVESWAKLEWKENKY